VGVYLYKEYGCGMCGHVVKKAYDIQPVTSEYYYCHTIVCSECKTELTVHKVLCTPNNCEQKETHEESDDAVCVRFARLQ
jgi:hypothetical protein